MRSRRFWFLALVAVAVACCAFGAKLWLVREYGSPTPYMDQWDGEAEAIYLPYLNGQLGWSHLWAPHNEHRIVWTNLLSLGLLEANGQWDPLLQMTVNAALHTLLALALVAWLARQVRGPAFAACVLLVVALFALPVAWENTLQGFQSQFYFLALFAFGHLVLTLGTRPGRGWWWLGLACGVAGLGASSGGFAAPLASTVVGAYRAWRTGERSRWTWIHLGVATACVAVGLAAVHHVPGHDELRAQSVGQFLLALLNTTGWPANFWLPLGLLTTLPFWLWIWPLLSRRTWDARDAVLLGLGAWGLLQCAALAVSRGNIQLACSPRYCDLFALLVLVSAVALARLRERPTRIGQSRLLPLGWALLVAAGLAVQTQQNFALFLTPLRDEWRQAGERVAAYVRGGDRAEFLAIDQALLPFPSAAALADWVDRPEIRRILPAALRAPVPLAADPAHTHGFVAERPKHLPADRDAVAGAAVWSRLPSDQPAVYRSRPLPAGLLPVLQLRFIGDRRLPVDAVRLEPAGGGSPVTPAIARWLGVRWQSANLARPDGPVVLVARAPAGADLAFADPVELGLWSWYNRSVQKAATPLFITGAVLLAVALTLVRWHERVTGGPAANGPGAPGLLTEIAGLARAGWRRTAFCRGPRFELAAWIGAAGFVAFAFFSPPIPMNAELDSSWQTTLLEARRHGWQFGTELNFTAGPWGWVTSLFAPAEAFDLRLWSDLSWRVLGLACLAATLRPLRIGRRWLTLIALLFFGGFFPDTLPLLALAGLVFGVLFRPDARPWAVGSALLVLTFYAQVKFTFALLGAAGVALAAVALWARGHRRPALLVPGGFAAGFVFWWLIAGQSLAHLPAYLRASAEIAGGYPQAMSVTEPTSVLWAGVAVLAVFALWALVTLRRAWASERLATTAALGFASVLWFVAWKHGFTRGDHHVCGFFQFVLVGGFAVSGWFDRDARWTWLDLTWLPALLGWALFDAPMLANTGWTFTGRTAHHAAFFTAIDAARAQHRREVEANARATRESFGDLAPRVGRARIDLLGFEQGALLLQGLNYAPRPVFQSYSAYTPALLAANAAYYAGPRAPEFVFARIRTIDGRYAAQDEAPALLELAARYEVLTADERGALLRQRATAPTRDAAPDSAGERRLRWGESLDLPAADNAVWWLSVAFSPSLQGALHDFVYKPAQVAMIVTDEHGRQFRHRLVPAAAAFGFPIQPLLETQADANAFFAGEARAWVRAVRFEPMNPQEKEFLGEPTVRWERRPSFPLRRSHPYNGLVEAGVLPAEPVALSAAAPAALADPPAGRAAFVHAPSELVLAVPAGANRLTANFGLLPGAYTEARGTDGAEFRVEALNADGVPAQLWSRVLDPVALAADRGDHALAVPLPAGTRWVVLRTDIGPARNASWDWTYWRAVSFSR